MKAVIDLENTISNASHRMHLLYHCKNEEFQDAFIDDSVNDNVKKFMWQLYKKDYEVVILTAKLSKYVSMVTDWLETNNVIYNTLEMKQSDLITDEQFKEEYIKINKNDIAFALDDVGRVCAIYEKYNVPCLRIEQK